MRRGEMDRGDEAAKVRFVLLISLASLYANPKVMALNEQWAQIFVDTSLRGVKCFCLNGRLLKFNLKSDVYLGSARTKNHEHLM
ncbi:hypothetical protein BCR34DRAFT_560097 [Clohesyomyces aquaticus]|uniref:Secreted protein n=1 Tax=Clohesyomyces aquaticus TaxID=1231657 RepID=A0A1Y1ZWV9_9PLEO|nr:hypothetical protein BCR34DRAFT_560097 [Clohesyomyces aquaticus]